MKQTNNAIKFLMAQYRAIFKNANLKMFLAAATAAAAMAAGSAQAATNLSDKLKDTSEAAVDITSSAADNTLNGATGNDTKYAKTLTIKNTHAVTVKDNLTTVGKVSVNEGGTLQLGADADSNTLFTAGSVENKGVITASGSVTTNSVKGWFGADATKTTSEKLTLNAAALTVTGADTIDLSTANMTSTGASSLTAEKSTVTLATGFEAKVPNVTASTILAKAAVPKSDEPLYGKKVDGKDRQFIYLKSGTVTALNELKVAPVGGEILVYKADKSGTASTLNLGDANTTNGKLTGFSRVLVGYSGGGNLNVNGKWDFGGARLTVGNGANVHINAGADVSHIEGLQFGAKNANALTVDGTLSINRLMGNEANASGSIVVNGTLNITGDGDLTDEGTLVNKVYFNDVSLGTAQLKINAGGTVALTTKDAWDDVLKVTTDDKGISTFAVQTPTDNKNEFGGWNASKVTAEAGGILRIDLSGYKVQDKTALKNLSDALIGSSSNGMVDLGGIGLATLPTADKDGYVSITDMPTVKTDATKNLDVKIDNTTLSAGAFSFGSASVKGDTLTTAAGSMIEMNKARDGRFATNNQATGDASKDVAISLAANSSLKLNGNGSIGDITKTSGVSGTAVVLGGENGNQTVGAVSVDSLNIVGGHVTAKDVTLSSTTDASSIMGDLDAKSLSISGAATFAGGADVVVESLTGASTAKIQIGEDTGSGLGANVITKKLELNSGSLFVDPTYGNKASEFVAGVLSGANTTAGTLDGDVYVGKNAAVGIGFEFKDSFDSYIAPYLNAQGSFGSGDGEVHNALVVNESLTLKSGHGVVLDESMTASNYTTKKQPNVVVVEVGSNLIITADALKNPNTAAITFGNAGSVSGAGTITLAGDIYSDAVDLTQAKLFQAASNANLTSVGNVKVQIGGGLYSTELTSGGTVDNTKWTANKALKDEVLAETSAPVGDFVLEYTKPNGSIEVTAENKVLNLLIDTNNWAGVDAAAHAATYAGAQQAAVAAVTTMADAVGGRVGSMGVEATAITATGSAANGGVWVAPMYKSVDADGFGAQGVSYGADVDLAGVAFGADTVNGNMRFGAVFNIGSGDADGKGHGNGLKDEFDYYGFGIYSVMGFGQLALVGDASLNVISHDVEGLGLKGSADTTAVTMGVTGQYTISNPMVDVTPHLGARFIRLDTESYDLTSADGVVATTDFEVQNVFSVPLGVTLSKAFEMGGWSLAPSADLTIAFNTGDTEADSTTRFAGVSQNIGLSTEVLDEVTYGINLGLGAQYGAFGTNIGINYTGSENTDSFGVNAQARYMF